MRYLILCYSNVRSFYERTLHILSSKCQASIPEVLKDKHLCNPFIFVASYSARFVLKTGIFKRPDSFNIGIIFHFENLEEVSLVWFHTLRASVCGAMVINSKIVISVHNIVIIQKHFPY